MSGKREEKNVKPGAKAMTFFKEGNYKEAINEYAKILKTMPDDERNKKVALYNRGMSYNKLGKHDLAFEDGESCLKIDPLWVKGYKCKGLALEGLGRLKDAINTFLEGQKTCSGTDENTEAILNPLIESLNQKLAEDNIKNTKKVKGKKPGAKAMELFKEGKFKEAITLFTAYLTTEPDDSNKKVAHYNRGMAYYNLGEHENALEDGEECLRIDPFWAKGYKCKGLALEEMGRLRAAAETFIDGRKMCVRWDQNTDSVLGELMKRINRVTGFLEDDLDLSDRMKKETYCVTCKQFEKDMGDGKKFISCDRCKMVNYCCQRHKEENSHIHDEVCDELLAMSKNSFSDFDVQIFLKEDALALLALKPKGPKGQQEIDILKNFELPPEYRSVMDYLRGIGDGNFLPLYQLDMFKPITPLQRKELNTWTDLFTIIYKKARKPRMTTDFDRVVCTKCIQAEVEERDKDTMSELTLLLTDPMTVFHAMKQVGLLNDREKDKILKLHVVGAEPIQEIPNIRVFFYVLSNLIGCELRIVYVGPLLTSPPGQVQILSPVITVFRGTYQEYILTSDYKKPDCIVAFFPGLYDGTYNWLPVVVYAIAKRVPFLFTCHSKNDYQRTKDWLMNGCQMKPEIVQDCLNPFGSREACQEIPGSNLIMKKNMFSVLFTGGDLGALERLLRNEDNEVNLFHFLLRTGNIKSLGDLLKLKMSSKVSMGNISILFGQVIRGLSAGSRVFEYMMLEPKINNQDGLCPRLNEIQGEIFFNNVRFEYPTRPGQKVLRGLNLVVRAGEMVALCGLSGSGKSTVASLIERFYDVDGGSITIDGHNIDKLSPAWIRGELVGYINQEPVLFATSVLENIRYGKPSATDEEVHLAARQANAHDFITKFPEGYETVLGERGVTVSGGQRQRIAIARALLKDPKILILDEATSALDAESERVVQEALDQLTEGRTVLVIAHRLSTIQEADAIAVLSDGKIKELGTHTELIKKNGLYAELVRRQTILLHHHHYQ